MQIDPAAVVFILWMAGILAVLATALFYFERKQQRADELEEFRRTIEAMRRLEREDGDR